MDEMEKFFGEVIHTYSRAEAIADGVLVDVEALAPGVAAEAGFKAPVALTEGVFEDCVDWSDADDARKRTGTGQDVKGRLWDVLYMAMVAARRNPGTDRVTFTMVRVPRAGRGLQPRKVQLVLHLGPGDTPEPVFTIMKPGED